MTQRSFTIDRPPGRSFGNPQKGLGHELIERAPEYAWQEGARTGRAVAERAKGVAVLRKADELMAESNPPGDTADNRRRALALACARCGVHPAEYAALIASDVELKSLEARVFDAAVVHLAPR